MQYFYYYLLFCVVSFIIIYPTARLEINFGDEEDTEMETFSMVISMSIFPILNIVFVLISFYNILYLIKDKKQERKERKSHPEKVSFDILKEIYTSYKDWDKDVQFQKITEKLENNIAILETRYKEKGYKEVLLRYEFTFTRINSIIKESSVLNINAYNQVLENSKELIEEFLKDCHLVLINEEEIIIKTEEAILSRILKEINEEKDFLMNRKS